MSDWRVVVDYPAVDAFLNGPVASEIAAAAGPRITELARRKVPRRTGALARSLHWDADTDRIGPFVRVGGNIYDMDIEAPAEQFKRPHPKALKTSLIEAISELTPLWS